MSTSPETPNTSSESAPAPKGYEGPWKVVGRPRAPTTDLSRSMIHLIGDPKIGKTTLMSQFPGLLCIATEKGQDWVEMREPYVVNSFTEFLDLCRFIRSEIIDKGCKFADGAPMLTIGLDTIDGIFKLCKDYVCATLNVEDLSEMGMGKGWSRLTSTWEMVMNKIRAWPTGLFCISHAATREFKMKGGGANKIEGNLGAAGARWANQSADLILYAHSRQVPITNEKGEIVGTREERQMLAHPTSWALAGGRMADRLPQYIPMSFDALAAYFPELKARKEAEKAFYARLAAEEK